MKFEKLTLILCIFLAACSLEYAQDSGTNSPTVSSVAPNGQSGIETTASAPSVPAAASTDQIFMSTETSTQSPSSLDTQSTSQGVEKTVTPASTPANLSEPTNANLQPLQNCKIGLGLRSQTIDILLEHKNQIGFVMSANSSLAEQYFDQFEGALRVLGAPSLQVLKEKGVRANNDEIPYEALGYGLETSTTTPVYEWNNLVGSTREARTLAKDLNKLLLMGPGFKLLSKNEDMYGPMGALADIWIFQTQQLQKNPPGIEYRQEVERIVKLIRSENPDIVIWAQITLPPDRPPDAEEWLAYRSNILDLVDGTYIGVYTWEREDQDQLIETIETIIETACEDQQ